MLVLGVLVAGPVRGQPAATPATDPKDPAAAGSATPPTEPSATPPASEDGLRRRARQIRELIAGTLDVEVEPESLFVIDLGDPTQVGPHGARLLALLQSLDQAEPEPAPEPPSRGRSRRRVEPEPEPEPALETPRSPADDYADALREYLELSADERQEVLDRHLRRRAAAKAEREASSRREARLAAVTRTADRLEAFLAGTLDLDVDPHALLELDLGDEEEIGLSPERRRTWPPPPSPTDGTTKGDAPKKEGDGTEGGAKGSTTDGGTKGDGTEGGAPKGDGTEGSAAKGDGTEGDGTKGDAPKGDAAEDAPPEAGTPPATPPSADALAVAEARLDELRRRFLALPESEKAAHFDLHARRQREAREAEAQAAAKAEAEAKAKAEEAEAKADLGEEAVQQITNAEAEAEAAAANKQKAEDEARRARSEADRILARERARLYDIQQIQANYEAEITRRRSERKDNHERATERIAEVNALQQGPLFGAELEQAADALYDGIRTELAATRERLREELRRVREAGTTIPVVGQGLDDDLPAGIDRGVIVELRETLLAKEAELTQLEQEVAWELAQGLRDDVVALNVARLALLDMASPSLRDAVTGFGPRGIDQVQRELDQISVELSFHVLKLPRYKDILLEHLSASPIGVFVGVVQVLLAGLVFLWWRRRSPDLFVRARRWLFRRRPVPRWATMSLTTLWFLERVRRPLELLVLLWLLLHLAGNVDDLPELALLWIVVSWILVGLAVILLLDALAARETRFTRKVTDTSALRIHSLRVVGLNVIAIGMLLGLTAQMVGKGAIYSWVLSTCWVLTVPVVLYLVHRWRPTIHERLTQIPEQGPFVKWALGQEQGLSRFPVAALAAAFLLGRGVAQWFMRRLSGRETTRRVLAYLFRREVAKRAAVAKAEQVERVDDACYSAFDPDRLEPTLADDVAAAELELVTSLVASPRPTFSAVVGERGMGKTTFLGRLQARVGERFKVLSCPEVGLEGLLPELAALTGDRERRDEALTAALRQMGPLVIAIDDAQRLIQPAIRGLRELDRLIALARDAGGQVSWVITMGAAAWHYLNRARGDRVFFEQVVKLPRWSEEQLGALIRKRCEQAGITPSYEGLVVPRQVDPLGHGGEDDRTEAGYYRLLWDFSRGNPAVALHAYRESLFVKPDGTTVVRLFKEPAAAEIESLSLPLLFVLRAIVQLDLAREHELTAATQLPATDVSDALRFCLARGYIEPYDAGVRVTWAWYRTITTVLQRQHLLSAPK